MVMIYKRPGGLELNDVKKHFYKEKRKAFFKSIRKGIAYYESEAFGNHIINFEIPVDDMGDAEFLPEMEARHLIRWITTRGWL